jgi:hypothetical protein
MLAAIAQMILPSIAVFTTLFVLMLRRKPKLGGVALFLRVGLIGLALAAGLFYLMTKTQAFNPAVAAVAINISRGLGMGGGLLIVMAAIGVMLKREQ